MDGEGTLTPPVKPTPSIWVRPVFSEELSIATNFNDNGGPIAPRLALLAGAGFTHIHWCEHWSRDFLYEDFYTEGVGRALAAAGLRLLDVHGVDTESARPTASDEAVRERGVRLLRNRIRFAARLGGYAVAIHPGPSDPATPDFAACWTALERSVAEVAPLCEATGVRVAIENGSPPMPPDFFRVVEGFPAEVAGYCFDSGHANLRGAAPDLFTKMAGRLLVLHLHDNHGERDEHALPGRGTIDWDGLMRRLMLADYRKPLNLELDLHSQSLPPAEFLNEAFRLGTELSRMANAKHQPAAVTGITSHSQKEGRPCVRQ